jgi:hypothetical protein
MIPVIPKIAFRLEAMDEPTVAQVKTNNNAVIKQNT